MLGLCETWLGPRTKWEIPHFLGLALLLRQKVGFLGTISSMLNLMISVFIIIMLKLISIVVETSFHLNGTFSISDHIIYCIACF